MRMFMVLLFVLGACFAAGQVSVADAPPPMTFESWRLVEEREDSIEYALNFPSAYSTEFPVNNVVPVRAILPADIKGPVPVVVLLHYLGATDLKIERSIAAELVRHGVAAVLVALPYHLGRTPPGHMSGELAVQADPEKLTATMVQSVWDVRRTMDWILTRPEFDAANVGIGGTSLGAIVATLVYAVDSRFSRASFVLSGADLAHIMWHSSRVVTQRDQLRSKGYTESKLREALRPIEPLEFLPGRGPGVTFVVGARHDTVIPPVDTQKLIDALHDPKVLWLDTGHYGGAFVQRKLLRTVATFFVDELQGRDFQVPPHLRAPTLRVGLDLNPTTGTQVAAGIDLWANNANADTFASFLLTPRGAQLFIGQRIDRGFAAGITIMRRGATIGAFWSTVL
jgi:dienelactone hydrolase